VDEPQHCILALGLYKITTQQSSHPTTKQLPYNDIVAVGG